MLENDLKKKLSELRNQININSKVLNISHNDMDGVGCNIVLNNAFKNVTFINTNYDDINEYLEELNLKKYDIIIISDISPETQPEILDAIDRPVVLLDHHETALHFHNPDKFRFIDVKISGTMMCKIFCETVLNISLSYLDELVFLINDYDMWHKTDERSTKMNILFYFYWEKKFYQRFFQGVVEFTDAEKQYIHKKEVEFEETWQKLEYYELSSINAAICDSFKFLNEIAERILNEGIDIVIIRNTKTQKLSIRSKLDDFKLGPFLKERDLGGGHPKAGAITYKNHEDFKEKLDLLERELHKEVPSLRIG